MGDGPYFPPPRKRGAYREPERPPLVEAPAEPKPVVVTRPALDGSTEQEEEELGETLAEAARSEREFWWQNGFFANYPRLTGAIALVAGLVLSVPALAREQASLRSSSMNVSMVFVLVAGFGLWALIVGAPADRDGQPRRWWTWGWLGTEILAVSLFAWLAWG